MPSVSFGFSFDPIQPASAHNPAVPKGALNPRLNVGSSAHPPSSKGKKHRRKQGADSSFAGLFCDGEPFASATQLRPSFPASFLPLEQTVLVPGLRDRSRLAAMTPAASESAVGNTKE